LSSQDTAAPKRRSAAANRRRKRRSDAQVNQGGAQPVVAEPVDADVVEPLSRSERKARAQAAADVDSGSPLPQEKHLRRQQERREAKSRTPEKQSGFGRLVNTQRFDGVKRFYRDTANEIKKVEWPDREATRNLTILVIALSTVLGLLLGGIDYVLFQIFEAFA